MLLSRDQGPVLVRTESGRFSSWLCCSCATQRNILPREALGFSYSIHHREGGEKEKYLTPDSSSWVQKNALSFGNTRILLQVKRLKNKSMWMCTALWTFTSAGCAEEPLQSALCERQKSPQSQSAEVQTSNGTAADWSSPIKFHWLCDMGHFLIFACAVIIPQLIMHPACSKDTFELKLHIQCFYIISWFWHK